MGELQSALKLHEAGRESLRKRLVEKEHLLEQTRIAAVGKVQSVEQLRDEEMGKHAKRIQEVTKKVAEVLDQLKRARLDVDDWTRSTKTYEELRKYLREEEQYARDFAERQSKLDREELDAERKKMQGHIDTLDSALEKAGEERMELDKEARQKEKDGNERKVKEAEQQIAILREQLAEADSKEKKREELAGDQLRELKKAFVGDVQSLAGFVEQLRTDALQANVYARSSTRLLRQQNSMLKKRIGHNMLITSQKQRRLVAWLGWRLVVQHAKALRASAQTGQAEVDEREVMIEALESRLTDTRGKYLRQLHTLQEAHEAELDAAQEEIHEATEAMARLKTFSAHKLSEMATQLEHAQLAAMAAGPPIQRFLGGEDEPQDGGGVAVDGSPAADNDYHHESVSQRAAQDKYVRKLERKVKKAEATELELNEFKQVLASMREMQGVQEAQQREASRRVAELEGELEGKVTELLAVKEEGKAAAATEHVRTQAAVDAAVALADGPRATEAAKLRVLLVRTRAKVAAFAIRYWARGKARLILTAWRECSKRGMRTDRTASDRPRMRRPSAVALEEGGGEAPRRRRLPPRRGVTSAGAAEALKEITASRSGGSVAAFLEAAPSGAGVCSHNTPESFTVGGRAAYMAGPSPPPRGRRDEAAARIARSRAALEARVR